MVVVRCAVGQIVEAGGAVRVAAQEAHLARLVLGRQALGRLLGQLLDLPRELIVIVRLVGGGGVGVRVVLALGRHQVRAFLEMQREAPRRAQLLIVRMVDATGEKVATVAVVVVVVVAVAATCAVQR